MSIIATSYEGYGHAFVGAPLLLITTLFAFGLLASALAATQREKLRRISIYSLGNVLLQYFAFCIGMGEHGWFALNNSRTADYAEFERFFFFVSIGSALLVIVKLFILPKNDERR